jgi:hypothetical protein
MRRFVLIIGIAVAGLAFIASDVQARSWKIGESDVKRVCGKDLQSGNGAFGCMKCGKVGCRDYSCSDGTNPTAGPKGCTRITAIQPGGTTGGNTPPKGKGGVTTVGVGPNQPGGTIPPKGKGGVTTAPVGGNSQSGSGTTTILHNSGGGSSGGSKH